MGAPGAPADTSVRGSNLTVRTTHKVPASSEAPKSYHTADSTGLRAGLSLGGDVAMRVVELKREIPTLAAVLSVSLAQRDCTTGPPLLSPSVPPPADNCQDLTAGCRPAFGNDADSYSSACSGKTTVPLEDSDDGLQEPISSAGFCGLNAGADILMGPHQMVGRAQPSSSTFESAHDRWKRDPPTANSSGKFTHNHGPKQACRPGLRKNTGGGAKHPRLPAHVLLLLTPSSCARPRVHRRACSS